MREIKFRVWDNSKKKMSDVGCIEFVDMIEGRTGVNAFTYENQIRKDHWIEDKDAVLMQFTGLKDKKGKEIYEGDIVCTFSKDKDPYFFHEVSFVNGAFCYKLKREAVTELSFHSNEYFDWKDGKSDEIEVIGNIYETPELLNREPQQTVNQ